MITVLAQLQWMTFRGRIVRSIRLLRQPKYLVGFVVGAVWISLWVIRPLLSRTAVVVATPWNEEALDIVPTIHRLAALLVTLFTPLPWLLPWGRLGLPFRESELTMLLQAPLTRRQVIQYGLLKSELGVVLSALIVSLLFSRGGPIAWLLGFGGTWILLDCLHLNGKWRALFNLRQTEIPVAVARRRRILLTVGLLGFYAVLLSALVLFLARSGALLREAQDWDQFVASLAALEWPLWLVALSTPAWLLTAPMFARGGIAFVVVALPSVLLLMAQREVVLRSRARFEESAIEQAKVRETKKSPTRRFARLSSRARSRRPFDLERPGPPALALVWKNAIRVSRFPWSRVALVASVLLVVLAVLPALLPWPDVSYGTLATIGLFLTALPPIAGGMAWNNDLRATLGHIELVRTWPVSPERFVLAEVVSPALISFFVSSFGAGMVQSALLGSRLCQLWTGERSGLEIFRPSASFMGVDNGLALGVLLAAVLPVTAAVSFCSSALQNLAVVFVPAWLVHSVDRNQGVAGFGQQMFMVWALALALLLALIPSVLLVGTAVLVQSWLGIAWKIWEFPVWGALAAIPLFVGGWLIVQLTAALWRRLDPSQEMLEIGR